MNNGQIILPDVALLPEPTQSQCRFVLLGDDHNAAGFPVQTVNQMDRRARAEIQPDAADQTGQCVTLGGMADQARWFVNDQQLGVFRDDVEQLVHAESFRREATMASAPGFPKRAFYFFVSKKSLERRVMPSRASQQTGRFAGPFGMLFGHRSRSSRPASIVEAALTPSSASDPYGHSTRRLSPPERGVSSLPVKEKSNTWLAVVLMVVFAATRWPDLLPANFSAAYALVFCAGVFLPRRLAWWLPLGTIAVTDLALNVYYHFSLHIDAFRATQFVNYIVYAAILWLGTRFNPRSSFLKLLSGGI